MNTTKKCTKCGEVKALDAFYADKRRKDGKTSSCKGCKRKYQKENGERLSVYKRKYREENREWISERDRKYRAENKERISERDRKYRQENKEPIAEYMSKYGRKYRQENPEVHRRAQRKRRAILRNLPHQPLTPQQYKLLHRQKYEIFGGIANEH